MTLEQVGWAVVLGFVSLAFVQARFVHEPLEAANKKLDALESELKGLREEVKQLRRGL